MKERIETRAVFSLSGSASESAETSGFGLAAPSPETLCRTFTFRSSANALRPFWHVGAYHCLTDMPSGKIQ